MKESGVPHLFRTAQLDDHLIVGFNERIPRYTSYPTATHFSTSVGTDTYERWLEALAVDAAISLYIHVPFCAELCLYCGCHTTVVRRYDPVASYVALLEREIDLVARRLGTRRRVVHIHWGGGTPTMLSRGDLLALAVRLRMRFEVCDDAEIAIEIDPRRLQRDHVAALAAIGVTRASLGVQDFDPEVQRAVNRIQSFEHTRRAVSWLREIGIPSINLDLMYGLPYQTTDKVLASVERALSLDPDRIALFGYAHVPWMKRHQKQLPEPAIPAPAERLRQMRCAAAAIVASGRVPIGLDHFAVPDDPLARSQGQGRLRRNFQGYTNDKSQALIGLGTSAIGMLPQGYVQNAATMPAYRDAIAAGRLATGRGVELTDTDRIRRAVIERLMCDLAVDLDRVAEQHNADPATLEPDPERLDTLCRLGLVRREAGRIVVSEAGRPFVRTVCALFDAYLGSGDTDPTRLPYSQAV
jgi:oxygen-independent coproporphyrinogen-3 oxidase